jgi:ferredoxin-NADP reductase
MARAALSGRLTWRAATLVESRPETPTARTLVLDVPDWPGHLPGQHVDVRLTAPDGYRAQRSYSIASAWSESGKVELTVQRLDDGEVSPYLTDVLEVGDQIELRGPVGGWFVWRPGQVEPVLLVGGGSGVVPLMSMLRHRRAIAPDSPMRLVYSVRTGEDVIYRDELGDETLLTYTRSAPDGWSGHTGRIDEALVRAAGVEGGTAFICGTNGFVGAAVPLVLAAGFAPGEVRTERFGPTGQMA